MSGKLEFRLLRADEIDCRISLCNEYGVGLLLYKDARCDQNILDETVGPLNWQRHHSRDNANCAVSIWDEVKTQWIEKEDTGTESLTEKEKGLASDSFKRACFNWGIGRELYTAPNIFVRTADLKTHSQFNGKWICKDIFRVDEIEYSGRNIVYVKIHDIKSGKFIEFGQTSKKEKEDARKKIIGEVKARDLKARCAAEGVSIETVMSHFKVNDIMNLTEKQYSILNQYWENFKQGA